MKQQLISTVDQRMSISASLQEEIEYWTKYVNERFAMAPTVKRLEGLDKRIYLLESSRYWRHDRNFMIPWLDYMISLQAEMIPQRTCFHFGVGHGDDTGYVPDALVRGFDLDIVDLVESAIKKTASRIKKSYRRKDLSGLNLPDPGHFVRFGNFEDIIASQHFVPATVSGCKIGRLLYHYGKERLTEILLNLAPLVTQPGRLIILIHHVPKFNVGYQYKTSFGYSLDEIMSPIREVAGPSVAVLNEKTLEQDTLWNYFSYQNLTWIVIGQR